MNTTMVLPKVLVANRGEIAARIIRTLNRMGIQSVAVHHALDRSAPYVRMANEAFELHGASPIGAYLDIDQLVGVCRQSGAEGVHPGYGFLSENEAFARELVRSGLVWIGPHAEAIAAMGDKIAAKHFAHQHGVTVVPGEHEIIPNTDAAIAVGCRIGFPIMLKASAGGGGRGVRIVRSAGEMAIAFASAVAEAKSAFGDGRVYAEKFIERPRHIEIQVAGDKHGNVIHLGERECSIQRRNQKILEEAPSPAINNSTRNAMGEQATALARAVGYDSVGTVEFIVDQAGQFYFIEMNTRLQVEHPVTEMVTGLDLVELQLRVAAGEQLPLSQDDVRFHGAAIELRLCAEDADNGFVPSAGRVLRFDPPEGEGVRLDSGIESGMTVSPSFDSLLAKLIVHAETRQAAIELLRSATSDLCLLGFPTNLGYLRRLVRHEDFAAGKTHTAFIDDHAAALARPVISAEERDAILAAAALADHELLRSMSETPAPLTEIGAWSNA